MATIGLTVDTTPTVIPNLDDGIYYSIQNLDWNDIVYIYEGDSTPSADDIAVLIFPLGHVHCNYQLLKQNGIDFYVWVREGVSPMVISEAS